MKARVFSVTTQEEEEEDESISSRLEDICDSGPLDSDDKVSEDTSGSITEIGKPCNDSSSHMDQDEQNDNGSQSNPHSKQEGNWVETTGTDTPPTEVMETLFTDMSFMDPGKIMTFAPEEGNKPEGIFEDTDSEFLSFPTIYCSKRRADNSERKVPVHYSDVCKWELRSEDRRAAKHIPSIFYK